MSKSILSVNAGSSSLKLSLYQRTEDKQSLELVINSSISGLNTEPKFSYKNVKSKEGQEISKKGIEARSDRDALEHFLKQLEQDNSFNGKDNISHICHRVVHGGNLGEKGPVIVDDAIYKELQAVTGLAPLHNGPALSLLEVCKKTLPKAINVAFFDSTFHASMPEFVKTYPIDQKIAKEKSLRKYGFHGISYQWILRHTAQHLGKEESDTSIVALHLGSGASMCAIKNGKSYDTTMGLTPLDGLPGGSRSGSIDPSLIFHYTSHSTQTDQLPPSVHLTHAENLLNSQSGFKALAGTSNFAEILAQDPLSPEGKLTIDIFLDRVSTYLGSYWLKLGGGTDGVDAFVFAGGIGEGSPQFRKMVLDVARKGFGKAIGDLDEEKNKAVEDAGDKIVVDIGKENSGNVRFLVCMTDEQLQMADELVKNDKLQGTDKS